MWEKLLEYIQQDPDLEVLIIDGTILPAHPCAAGKPLWRSKGGFTTKIHASVDAADKGYHSNVFVASRKHRVQIHQKGIAKMLR